MSLSKAQTFDSLNPVNDEVIASHPITDEAGVRAAVATARTTALQWREIGFSGRKKMLLKWSTYLMANVDELAELVSLETGKPTSDAKLEAALAAGHIVVSDRFTDASFAYQGGGRGLSIEKLNALEQWVQMQSDGRVLQPNTTFLFDLPGAVAEARRSKARTPDKFERLDLAFFERVRQEYLRRAKADPDRFVLVDATQTQEAIWDFLCQAPLAMR